MGKKGDREGQKEKERKMRRDLLGTGNMGWGGKRRDKERGREKEENVWEHMERWEEEDREGGRERPEREEERGQTVLL